MADMAKITGAAWKEAGDNMRTTATDNISALHDLYNVVQDVNEASKLLHPYNVLKNVVDSTGGKLGDKGIVSAIQGVDIAGRTTPESLQAATETLAGSVIALGKRFDPSQFKTNILTSGDARFGWNDEFLTKGLPAIIALGGGNRTGSMMYQMQNNLWAAVAARWPAGSRLQRKKNGACTRPKMSSGTARSLRGSRLVQSLKRTSFALTRLIGRMTIARS